MQENDLERRGSSHSTDSSGSFPGSGGYDECRAPLEDSDHLAVHCVHIFMQNLYHYATQDTVSDPTTQYCIERSAGNSSVVAWYI